jgi:hypothetical protein
MKWWDIKTPRLNYNRGIVNKFFKSLEVRGGLVGNQAVLFCYNEEAPELSYILTEHI